GPHMGFMWGRYDCLKALPTFREDFIPDEPPGKIEAGTFIYENVAGMDAAVQYLAALGRSIAGSSGPPTTASLRAGGRVAMDAIQAYEQWLSVEMLKALAACGAHVYGVRDESLVAQRVPTFCFNMPGIQPQVVVRAADRAGFAIRDGHLYAPRLMKRLH